MGIIPSFWIYNARAAGDEERFADKCLLLTNAETETGGGVFP